MRSQFTFYKSFDDVIEDMNDKQIVEYVKALLDVQFLRQKLEDISFDDKVLSMVWKSQKHSIQSSIDGYLNSQKKDGVKSPYYGVYSTPSEGGIFDPYEGGRQQDKEKEKEEGKEKEEDQGKQKAKRFTPPSLEEVTHHIEENQLTVNAEAFFYHYESKGWKIGKESMKSWTAALAQWNAKDKSKQPSNNQLPKKQFVSFAEQKVLNQEIKVEVYPNGRYLDANGDVREAHGWIA
jgi:hypothetical protein